MSLEFLIITSKEEPHSGDTPTSCVDIVLSYNVSLRWTSEQQEVVT